MIKHFAALACVTALVLPASAEAAAIIEFDGTSEISDGNDFKSALSSLGLTRYATLDSSIMLDANSSIRFDFLGSESGNSDTFFTLSMPALSYTEMSPFEDHFLSPLLIGTAAFGSGSLAGLLNFLSSAGDPATVGEDGFGIFLREDQVSGGLVNTFYFGYDDRVTGDDDHDDFIVRATLLGASPRSIPEPAVWLMLLAGFGLAGAALRRRVGRDYRLRATTHA